MSVIHLKEAELLQYRDRSETSRKAYKKFGNLCSVSLMPIPGGKLIQVTYVNLCI